jgi:hypothetical protein
VIHLRQEHFPGAGEHHHAVIVVLSDLPEGIPQLRMEAAFSNAKDASRNKLFV